jgi:hypothetical protein
MATNDDLLNNSEDNDTSDQTTDPEMNVEYSELVNKQAIEQAQRNLLARKRIDDLLEKKRLKELLDDSDDW